MSQALHDALAALPGLIAAHVLLAAAALAAAVLLALPVAIWAAARPRARGVLLGLAGLIQTVPALALLALFYPLLLAIGAASGAAVPALGFLPAFIALALYAVLPILRNGVAAIAQLDPDVVEAAQGLGMTRAQRLRIVELPLAAPVMMAGVRTAAVWTIGTATLATTVGAASLGNLIFAGLQTEDWTAVLTGCAAAAALALVTDGALALVEHGLAKRTPWRVLAGSALVIAGVAAAAAPRLAPSHPVVVIGAKNFSEQYILASLIQRRLRHAGFATARRDDLGSAVAYRALAAGDIDAYVDYTGTLWANVLGRKDNPPRAQLLSALTSALTRRNGVVVAATLGFENAYALAMRRDRAKALGITSLADLAAHAPSLRLASDLEFLSRPEWRAVAAAYGLRFAEARAYSPTFMYRAVAGGQADVISAFSSDGRIAALDLVTLADPRRALPSYDAVLLVTARRARDARFMAALRPLAGTIPVERMRRANLMVDRDADKRTPAQAAAWLLP